MLTSSFLNILLICLPIGIWAGATGASPTLVFSTVGWSLPQAQYAVQLVLGLIGSCAVPLPRERLCLP